MNAVRKSVMFPLLILAFLGASPGTVFGQTTSVTASQVPMERYSLSPFLEDPFLMLLGTTLPDVYKLDLSLGIKYMHEPWRVLEKGNPDFLQTPVEELLQFRPAISFAFKQWLDLALVIPFSDQVAGAADSFTNVSGQGGLHFLNPEFFFRVPFLHRRISGFGLAGAGQLFIPIGSDQPFVGMKSFQAAVVLAADWVWESLAVMLNTGFLFRQEVTTLNTPIGNEWFFRPGVAYRFPLGTYSVGLEAEVNIATGLSSFFSNANTNAFQFLFALVLQPNTPSGGIYAVLGGGPRLESGGYAVPEGSFDGRLGYSFQWSSQAEETEVAAAGQQPKPVSTTAPPAAGGSVAAASEPGPAVAVVAQPGPAAAPAGRRGPKVREIGGEGEEPQAVAREVGTAEPVAVATAFGQQLDFIKVDFSTGVPGPRKGEWGAAPGSAAISETVREQMVANKDKLLRSIQIPGARLVVVGFADKCFEGPPPLANVYNRDLSQRRAEAMVSLLKEVLGRDLSGIEIRTVAMGRGCANPRCVCANADMPECADDRKVELFVQTGEANEYRCPNGSYWLAR